MAYEESRIIAQKTQSINLENREKLSISGVEDVSGFDETLIVLDTCLGGLSIRGDGLHIDRIDLEAGQLEVRGKIQELNYESLDERGSVWSRLFG